MRDLINLLESIALNEKSRGLLYRNQGDSFFQGPVENPTAEIVFDKVDYFPSMPGSYADYEEMANAGKELFRQYPAITWFNKPTAATKSFAIITFDGPAKGQKTYFGKFFNEIKQDMTGFWKNNELPGGWQLNKASSLKAFYKLKPADLFLPDSRFDSPADCVAALGENPKDNPAVPKIMPGMKELLTKKFPLFADIGEMGAAVRDDLGETIGPIALIQGMITTQGAEAARKELLGPNGSYAGSSIYFPEAKNNGLVDSYITTPGGIEIGISSKGDSGANASIKNVSDGVTRAREKNMTDLLEKYADQLETITEVGSLSSRELPIVLGIRQGLITESQGRAINALIDSNAKSLDAVNLPAEDLAVVHQLMKQIPGAKTDNPRYNVGFHALSALARNVSTNVNKDPKFGEACLKFLNVAPIIQLHLMSTDKGGSLQVTGFTSKYPPDFKGTVGLDASKTYAATGTNGRVSFSYNGGGNQDTDPANVIAPPSDSVSDLDAVAQKRSGIKAATKKSGPADDSALGRKRR